VISCSLLSPFHASGIWDYQQCTEFQPDSTV
jgi:hypothetical protein